MFKERQIAMLCNNIKTKKGFTLIELMVVIFIIGILSAVAIPYMRGRTDASKWTEGKAAMGSIHTVACSASAEKPTSPSVVKLEQAGRFVETS